MGGKVISVIYLMIKLQLYDAILGGYLAKLGQT
jgi:hypothetical protein